MKANRKLRMLVPLSLAGVLALGLNPFCPETLTAVAAAAPAVAQQAEFHNGTTNVANSAAITILPINRAKLWAGQRFDFEVEFPAGSTNLDVRINGESAESVFGKKAVVKDYGTHISYRINNVDFDQTGDKTITATAGSGLSKTARYQVVQEKAKKRAKNVILFIGDGMSMQAKELGRILSKGLSDGKFNDLLAMEKMPNMALITTSGYDSIVTDSANSMSAYMTGNKSVVNAMGVYENKTKDPLDDPKVETVAEILSRSKNMSYGMVSTASVTDATPAAVTAHTRRRAEQNYIAADFLNRNNPPSVVMGGGAQFFLPLATPGSKRKDNRNLIQEFEDKGYAFAGTKAELNSLGSDKPILGLFTMNHMNVYMDREFLPKNSKVLKGFTDQPGLLDMTKKAVSVLEKNPNGFFLMSEGGSIDKQLHTMDWQRSTYDTIEFDKTIEWAQQYAKEHNDDTLIIVVADHAHGVSITGTYKEENGKTGREAVRVYGDAKWPTFVDANKDGYPDNPDPDVTLAVQYANAPDHYENYRFQQTPTVPATTDAKGHVIANPKRAPRVPASSPATCPPTPVKPANAIPLTTSSSWHRAPDPNTSTASWTTRKSSSVSSARSVSMPTKARRKFPLREKAVTNSDPNHLQASCFVLPAAHIHIFRGGPCGLPRFFTDV
jgi:alkaline phosphatase